MHESVRVDTLSSLRGYQVGQKHFHSAAVGRIELSYVQYAQGPRMHCLLTFGPRQPLRI